MNRLTKKEWRSLYPWEICGKGGSCKYCDEERSSSTGCHVVNVAKKLAEYEDLEEQDRIIIVPETGKGDVSDGYHTFNELYEHRAILFCVICHSHPDRAWKSKKHDDGTMYEGMFIVGLNTEYGQVTYHFDIEPYWDLFLVEEFAHAPKWDGHTSEQALSRLILFGCEEFYMKKQQIRRQNDETTKAERNRLVIFRP